MPEPDHTAYDFAFDAAYRFPARLFGVSPASAHLTVSGGQLHAQFGPWHIHTPLTNIVSVQATGPYRFLRTAGPARLALSDRGLTFATNSREGVEIGFRDPIPGIEPTGRLRHPNLTVTVTDCARLAATLTQQLHPETTDTVPRTVRSAV